MIQRNDTHDTKVFFYVSLSIKLNYIIIRTLDGCALNERPTGATSTQPGAERSGTPGFKHRQSLRPAFYVKIQIFFRLFLFLY